MMENYWFYAALIFALTVGLLGAFAIVRWMFQQMEDDESDKRND